jgi:hypothetical protein
VSDSPEYDEIIAKLADLKQELATYRPGDRRQVPEPIPLIDPTANVKELVQLVKEQLKEVRETDDRWGERMRITEEKYEGIIAALRNELVVKEAERIDAVNLSEARRIDAQISDMKSAVALASKEAASTAAGIATSLANTTTLTSDRMIRIEQWQAARGGQDIQRTESKGDTRYGIMLLMAAPGIIATIIGLILLARK